MSLRRPFLRDFPEALIGPRVMLRRWRDDDAQPLFDAIMESRDHLQRWMLWAASYHTVDDAVEFVRRQSGHWALDAHVGMGLFARQGETLLGSAGFHVRSFDIPSIEIGYWLRQSAEGHGYMTEAVRLITNFAFDEFGARRVMIRCDARNARSKAVAERLGYVFEGCHRNDSLGTDGDVRDTLVYAMTPEDFAAARAAWT
jgi:ribosomal-protein-serine acetyltransferase